MKHTILAALCGLLFLITPLGAVDIKNYDELKKEFQKAVHEKKDPGYLVELLTKFSTPDLLGKFVLKNEFYKDIFNPLLNALLINGKVSWISSIANKIPDDLSKDEQKFVAKKIAESFNKLFMNEGFDIQKFDLATDLYYSALGNKILLEWLKLDPKLPFVQGKLIDSKKRESSLNVMQQMLREYSFNLIGGGYPSIKKSEKTKLDKKTIESFINAWNKSYEKEKAFVAHINGSRKGNAFISGHHVWAGDYTVKDLAKAIKLGYFFEEPEDKISEDAVDQFARACYSIASEK